VFCLYSSAAEQHYIQIAFHGQVVRARVDFHVSLVTIIDLLCIDQSVLTSQKP
jgi:hypothetical protein